MSAPRHWEPGHYLQFASARLRPALDLLARVPVARARAVTDLGCGAGNMAPHLRERFPEAAMTGVDGSAEMLARARADFSGAAAWVRADIAAWTPEVAQDVIFSNAALHWLDDHAALFPRLLGFVAPGGALAVQMPNQFAEPSHALMRQTAAEGPWAKVLVPLLRPEPVAPPAAYYGWLAPLCATVDIWETSYVQVMEGEDAVLAWISSTALKPLLEALEGEAREAFRAALASKLRHAYPRRADGATLFPFKRLFVVAHKG